MLALVELGFQLVQSVRMLSASMKTSSEITPILCQLTAHIVGSPEAGKTPDPSLLGAYLHFLGSTHQDVCPSLSSFVAKKMASSSSCDEIFPLIGGKEKGHSERKSLQGLERWLGG